jgi:hypothetical protein
VTQPSDVVVMENVVRAGTEGSVEVIQAKYELLRRGSYLMNQDAAKLKLKPLEPGAPLDLAPGEKRGGTGTSGGRRSLRGGDLQQGGGTSGHR